MFESFLAPFEPFLAILQPSLSMLERHLPDFEALLSCFQSRLSGFQIDHVLSHCPVPFRDDLDFRPEPFRNDIEMTADYDAFSCHRSLHRSLHFGLESGFEGRLKVVKTLGEFLVCHAKPLHRMCACLVPGVDCGRALRLACGVSVYSLVTEC